MHKIFKLSYDVGYYNLYRSIFSKIVEPVFPFTHPQEKSPWAGGLFVVGLAAGEGYHRAYGAQERLAPLAPAARAHAAVLVCESF